MARVTQADVDKINATRNTPFVVAARVNDAECEKVGLLPTVQARGVDIALLRHIAEQRALRIIARIDPVADFTTLVSAYFDGLMIGWYARELQSTGVPAELQVPEQTVAEVEAYQARFRRSR
jgi:hypothetical protein